MVSKVVIVNNIPETNEKGYPDLLDKLHKLFGHYGNVNIIKILFKNRRNGLIEYDNAEQAITAMQNLQGIRFFGNTLRVNESHQNSIDNIQDTDPQSRCLWKDFTNSNSDRFGLNDTKKIKQQPRPSKVLHFSNFDTNFTFEQL